MPHWHFNFILRDHSEKYYAPSHIAKVVSFCNKCFSRILFLSVSPTKKMQGQAETGPRLICPGSQLTMLAKLGSTLHMQQEILFGKIEQLFILPAPFHLQLI